MKGGKPRIDSVFGPPWREDYRREENKLSHTGPQGVGGFLRKMSNFDRVKSTRG